MNILRVGSVRGTTEGEDADNAAVGVARASTKGASVLGAASWERLRASKTVAASRRCTWVDLRLLDAVQLAQECIALPDHPRILFGGVGESGVEDGVLVAQATHLILYSSICQGICHSACTPQAKETRIRFKFQMRKF